MKVWREPLMTGCKLCCDRSVIKPNDAKCRELMKSHLSCRECAYRLKGERK